MLIIIYSPEKNTAWFSKPPSLPPLSSRRALLIGSILFSFPNDVASPTGISTVSGPDSSQVIALFSVNVVILCKVSEKTCPFDFKHNFLLHQFVFIPFDCVTVKTYQFWLHFSCCLREWRVYFSRDCQVLRFYFRRKDIQLVNLFLERAVTHSLDFLFLFLYFVLNKLFCYLHYLRCLSSYF